MRTGLDEPNLDYTYNCHENHEIHACRRRFDYVIRVTRTAGDGRKEGAKHIKTYSPSNGRKPGQRGVNGVLGVGLVG